MLPAVGSPAVVGMVLLAMSLMLLLMELDGQLPMALSAEAEVLAVRDEALPLVHDALSQLVIELPDVEVVAILSVAGVDCAWVSAGIAAIEVIKAAVAAICIRFFIWSVLVETGRGTLNLNAL